MSAQRKLPKLQAIMPVETNYSHSTLAAAKNNTLSTQSLPSTYEEACLAEADALSTLQNYHSAKTTIQAQHNQRMAELAATLLKVERSDDERWKELNARHAAERQALQDEMQSHVVKARIQKSEAKLQHAKELATIEHTIFEQRSIWQTLQKQRGCLRREHEHVSNLEKQLLSNVKRSNRTLLIELRTRIKLIRLELQKLARLRRDWGCRSIKDNSFRSEFEDLYHTHRKPGERVIAFINRATDFMNSLIIYTEEESAFVSSGEIMPSNTHATSVSFYEITHDSANS